MSSITHPTPNRTASFLIAQTICQLSIAYLLVYVFQQNILQRLDEDSKLMERWEPTDILSQVFPYHLLKAHVYMVTIGIIGVSIAMNLYSEWLDNHYYICNHVNERKTNTRPYNFSIIIPSYLFMMGTLFGSVLFGFILCGASPFENVSHTLLASWYFTLHTFGYCRPPPSTKDRFSLQGIIVHLFSNGEDESEVSGETITSPISESKDRISRFVMYTTLFVTIPFQILHILDHGDQIQRWPIPVILGSTIGHCLGSSIGLLLEWIYLFRSKNNKKIN